MVPVENEGMAWTVGTGLARGQDALRGQVNQALAGMAQTVSTLASKYGLPQAPALGPGGGEHKPPADAIASSSAVDGAAGHKLFNENCAHCHGLDAIQGERRRNLRLLQRRYGDEVREAFMATVTHGRVTKGMPNWSGILSTDEFNEILAFLLSVQEQ